MNPELLKHCLEFFRRQCAGVSSRLEPLENVGDLVIIIEPKDLAYTRSVRALQNSNRQEPSKLKDQALVIIESLVERTGKYFALITLSRA